MVRQPSIAGARHFMLAVSTTIFWFQNQKFIFFFRKEIKRTHSIHTFFIWGWGWKKERLILWSFYIIEARGLNLKSLNKVASASAVPHTFTINSRFTFTIVVSHKKLPLSFAISWVSKLSSTTPRSFLFFYGKKSLQLVWLTELPIQRWWIFLFSFTLLYWLLTS